jgi:hypothetical protein
MWYTFVAPCTGVQRLNTCGSTFDTVLSVYRGTCGAPSEIACNDDTHNSGSSCDNTLQSFVAFNAVAGETLRVRVSGFNGNRGAGVLNHACVLTCPCDWNHNFVLNSQDFFDFINGFFAGNADYNNSGATTSQDFFDFLTCFFAPPPACT